MSETKYTVEVVYLGERVDSFDKILQCFRDKKGEKYWFTGVKWVWFDHSYMLSKDGKIARKPESVLPEKRKVRATEQERLDYETHKELAKHVRAIRSKAMQIKKPHPDIEKAVKLLKPFCRNLDFIQLARFTEYLRNRLSKRK